VSDPEAAFWTDTHCHLQDTFLTDGSAREDIIDRADDAGVRRAICIGTGLESSRAAIALARHATETGDPVALWSSAGLHPHDATDGVDPIVELVTEEKPGDGPRGAGSLVAVGECGLDYFYEHSPRDVQRTAFARQIELAASFGLTLVVHTRDAFADTIAMLADAAVRPRTVIHCFTGGPADAEALVELGCYLSFSGIVTFKNAEPTRAAARLCPADRLLVETDSPFLAPVPYRGRPNEPAHVSVVGAALAELRGEIVADVAERTSANAVVAFGLAV
jgi:TatD DNase family protein